jgi:tRNA threonylcarbamoyladenosine biosynthesis protein TsaE
MSLSPEPLGPDSPLRLVLPTPAATERLAGRLAAVIRPGDAVLLRGPIGAGKSTLVRALLRAASGNPELDVPSPTFTLVQSYDLPGEVVAHHFDLWRLAGPDALAELGWEDALRDIVLVEWPERLGPSRPAGALEIDLSARSDDARVATLSGWPDRLAGLA